MNTTIKDSTINIFVTKIQLNSKIVKGVMIRSRTSDRAHGNSWLCNPWSQFTDQRKTCNGFVDRKLILALSTSAKTVNLSILDLWSYVFSLIYSQVLQSIQIGFFSGFHYSMLILLSEFFLHVVQLLYFSRHFRTLFRNLQVCHEKRTLINPVLPHLMN